MGDLQRLSPCGRVEPEAYAGRKIRHLNLLTYEFAYGVGNIYNGTYTFYL